MDRSLSCAVARVLCVCLGGECLGSSSCLGFTSCCESASKVICMSFHRNVFEMKTLIILSAFAFVDNQISSEESLLAGCLFSIHSRRRPHAFFVREKRLAVAQSAFS